MIDPLDSILLDLVQSRIPAVSGPAQVGFAPPNADWKASVASSAQERVNFYLYDLRESVALRTNERVGRRVNGSIVEDLPSPRVDCTYLVTAWSPVAITPLVDATRDEHRLLSTVLALLMKFRPIVAAEVYSRKNPLNHALTTVPLPLQEQPLPVSIAMPDAVKEPTEFWTTMKIDWKPAIRYTVTVPIVLDEPTIDSPMVTTLTGRYGTLPPGGSVDTLMSIGGRVLRTGDDTPIEGAWVQIAGTSPPALTAIRQQTTSDPDGRFIFSQLPPGTYELRAVRNDLGDRKTTGVDIPHPSGDFTLHLP
jgi:hypothetical protein